MTDLHTPQIWRDLNKKYGHGNWKNLRVHNSHYGGQIGYSYQVIDKTLPVNPEKQFVRFMRENSNGLNSLGQTFLVQSIEAFIYSILGAQADSRFSIVNQGGKSLQTQQIFHQLVQSSIVQNDNTIMINNFRTAIKDTNQILYQNISPGLLIIPFELTILKNPIPRYNNSITTSTLNMRFGVNQNLNKTAPQFLRQVPLAQIKKGLCKDLVEEVLLTKNKTCLEVLEMIIPIEMITGPYQSL